MPFFKLMNTKKIGLYTFPVLAAIMIGSSFSPAFAGGTYSETINTKTDLDILEYIPCANDGIGENVHLVGTLHTVLKITSNNEGFTVFEHHNPQGVSGYGVDTGDSYQGTGVTRNITHSDDVLNDTFVNNFRIIGQGNGNNYLVHTTSHFTINANGDLTADVHFDRIECK